MLIARLRPLVDVVAVDSVLEVGLKNKAELLGRLVAAAGAAAVGRPNSNGPQPERGLAWACSGHLLAAAREDPEGRRAANYR